MAAIAMEDGWSFMKYNYPEIEVFAEFRSRIFCNTNSPFNLSHNRHLMREICLKYGQEIRTGYIPSHSPLGYSKSEALVAFDYGTPNNTIPIIWGDAGWRPIFPRQSKSRMKKASEIKTEASFYLGLIYKLHLPFTFELNGGEYDTELGYRDCHAILVYLILIDRLYNELQICQILGITLTELTKINTRARSIGLVTKEGIFTREGLFLVDRLKRQKNIEKFRENDTFAVRNVKVFVPKTFRKKS